MNLTTGAWNKGKPDRWAYCEIPNILRSLAVLLICIAALDTQSLAQASPQVFTVTAAKQNAAQLGAGEVRIRGHFWWGKEGSMIYDSYYKAILGVQYSRSFEAKHPRIAVFVVRRKSNIAVISGHLSREEAGRIVVVADDIEFTGERKL